MEEKKDKMSVHLRTVGIDRLVDITENYSMRDLAEGWQQVCNAILNLTYEATHFKQVVDEDDNAAFV